MSLSSLINAHECTGTPTPEDEARLDATLNKIFDRKESSMTNVTTQETINVAEVVETSATTAQELLKQAGWDIVNSLAATVAEGIQTTALVILPVAANLADYQTKLTDPKGFEAKFNTLKTDVQTMSKAVSVLFQQHDTKKGEPKPEELPLINTLTLGYSKVQGHLEAAIHPLMLNLVEELEEVGVTDLTIKDVEDAA